MRKIIYYRERARNEKESHEEPYIKRKQGESCSYIIIYLGRKFIEGVAPSRIAIELFKFNQQRGNVSSTLVSSQQSNPCAQYTIHYGSDYRNEHALNMSQYE